MADSDKLNIDSIIARLLEGLLYDSFVQRRRLESGLKFQPRLLFYDYLYNVVGM